MEENNQQNIPLLCRKGCGFYGSPNFDGLCSKCHRSAQVQLENTQPSSRSSVIDSKLSITERRTPEPSDNKAPPTDTRSGNPPVSIKVTAETELSDKTDSLSGNSDSSQQDLQADAEVAAASLSDDLLDALKEDSKPGSPASSCSSTGTTSKKRPRCDVCHKRVGLTGFTCRCGGLYCSLHRYSDSHSCSFDYRESGQEEIRRSNPQIVCQKVQKI